MAFRKTKGQRGEATKYVTRNKALRMLQLPLRQFRRLCILKGVYPREPKSRIKAQRGDSNIKTLYLKRDIIYLSHEPIIWKIREEKIHKRQVSALKGKKQLREAKFKTNLQKPTYKIDHIVLERYPTFDKALDDLDDALSAMFLFAALPFRGNIDADLIQKCKKLTTEFLIYVIESHSLTKTFVCIRGYFYRAHIMGHIVTWMIPHPFPIQNSEHVEMKVMESFIEFYCTLLGFVNYKLFTSLNLYYPPKLIEKFDPTPYTSKREMIINVIESLNIQLERDFVEQDEETENENKKTKQDTKKLKLAYQEREKIKNQKKLFKDVKFFLGREINRESLTLVIRSAGGEVSWDESLGPGWTYPESDKTIQYQIVDRPSIEKKHLNRYYIQPQWVYDSFNAGMLLPVQNYFVGSELPAHLSPFEEAYHKVYNPPEMLRMNALQKKIDIIGDKTIEELKKEVNLIDCDDEEEAEVLELEEANTNENEKDGNEEKESPENKNIKEGKKELDALDRMRVKRGRPYRFSLKHQENVQASEDFKLASSFIHRKQKRFFKKMLQQEIKVKKHGKNLRQRRILYEKEMQNRRIAAAKKLAKEQFAQ